MNAFDMIYRMLDDREELLKETMTSGVEYEGYQGLVGRIWSIREVRQEIKDIEERVVRDDEQ